MSDEIIATPICPACSAELPAGVEKCPKCGHIMIEAEDDTLNLRGDEWLLAWVKWLPTLIEAVVWIALIVGGVYWVQSLHKNWLKHEVGTGFFIMIIVAPLAGLITRLYYAKKSRAAGVGLGCLIAIATFIIGGMTCASAFRFR